MPETDTYNLVESSMGMVKVALAWKPGAFFGCGVPTSVSELSGSKAPTVTLNPEKSGVV